MNLLSFDLNLLKVLDALLRDPSVTRAAERVGLSQPAVSAALKRLRTAFGDPLFVRNGQRLVPTPFALTLAGPLDSALATLGTVIASEPDFDPATATGRFRMYGSDDWVHVLMPELARRLAREEGILAGISCGAAAAVAARRAGT